MAIEAKMMYVLAEIECNYTLKHVFDDKISYLTNYTSNLCYISKLQGTITPFTMLRCRMAGITESVMVAYTHKYAEV